MAKFKNSFWKSLFLPFSRSNYKDFFPVMCLSILVYPGQHQCSTWTLILFQKGQRLKRALTFLVCTEHTNNFQSIGPLGQCYL